MWVMKYLVALAFLGILASLGLALFFMLRDGRDGRAKSGGMARALTVRIGLVGAFVPVHAGGVETRLHPAAGIPGRQVGVLVPREP